MSAIGRAYPPPPPDSSEWGWATQSVEQPVLTGPARPSIGVKPTGAHDVGLGGFGCLRDAPAETVVDVVVGQHVGDVRPESDARETLRWVRGIDVGNGSDLGVEAVTLRAMGLVRGLGFDGVRYWQRVRSRPLPADAFRAPLTPPPVPEIEDKALVKALEFQRAGMRNLVREVSL